MENPMFSWKTRGSLEQPGFSKIEANPRFPFFTDHPTGIVNEKLSGQILSWFACPGWETTSSHLFKVTVKKRILLCGTIPPTKGFILRYSQLEPSQVVGFHIFGITRLQVSLNHFFIYRIFSSKYHFGEFARVTFNPWFSGRKITGCHG